MIALAKGVLGGGLESSGRGKQASQQRRCRKNSFCWLTHDKINKGNEPRRRSDDITP